MKILGQRLVFLQRALALGALGLLASCGGGGSASVGNAPSIANLIFSPQAVYASDTPQDFLGQLDFTDPDGNLASVTLTVTDAAGATVGHETLPIGDVAGLTSGAIAGVVTADVSQSGRYTLRIFVTDTTGLRSNVLSGSLRIADFPWVTKTAGPSAREYAAAAALDGRVYLLGGQLTNTGATPGPATNLVEVYDPATDSWTSGPPLPTARMGLVAAVQGGKLYAIGGRTDGFSTSAVGTVEVFDPATQAWTTRNPMPNPRFFAAAAPLGGRMLVTGGERLTQVLDLTEAYEPLVNAWSNRSALPQARGQLGAAVIDNRLYAVGGYAGLLAQWVGTLEVYDPLLDQWSPAAPMPTARAHAATAAVDGQLLVAGGENQARSLAQLEIYDASTRAWRAGTPSPLAFTRAASAVVDGKLYVFADGLALAYDPANEIR